MPRFMTDRHPRAAGSLYDAFDAWTRERFGMHPKRTTGRRWWQELVARRALEVDEDGRLVWDTICVSTPRQQGKSWLLRELCLWRLAQAERLGEVQTVLHTARKLQHAHSVWYPAGRWASHRPEYRVRFANGEQRIEAGDGSLWMIQAANDGLGVSMSVSLGLVDEAWAVKRELIDNGLQPTLAESEQPQLWVISTAGVPSLGESVTDLVPGLREVGFVRDQSSVLLLEWSSPRLSDADDPGVWRMSSAHWDERRLERVSQARAKATRPEAVESFRRQWLNQWPASDDSAALGWGARLLRELPPGVPVPAWVGPLSGGLESERDGSAWGVAVSDGRHVECASVGRLGQALEWLRARGPVEVLCHEAVRAQVGDADWLRPRRVSVSEAAAATAVLRDAVPRLSWSGVLADELRRAQVSESGGVQRIDAALSGGGVSGLKAASWALWAGVTRPAVAPAVW